MLYILINPAIVYADGSLVYELCIISFLSNGIGYLKALNNHTISTEIALANLLGNFFMFMPMGFFLPYILNISNQLKYFLIIRMEMEDHG